MQPFVSSDPRVEKRSSEIVALSVTSPHHPHSPAASSGNLQKMDQPLDHSALTMYWADPQRERGGGRKGREREKQEKGVTPFSALTSISMGSIQIPTELFNTAVNGLGPPPRDAWIERMLRRNKKSNESAER